MISARSQVERSRIRQISELPDSSEFGAQTRAEKKRVETTRNAEKETAAAIETTQKGRFARAASVIFPGIPKTDWNYCRHVWPKTNQERHVSVTILGKRLSLLGPGSRVQTVRMRHIRLTCEILKIRGQKLFQAFGPEVFLRGKMEFKILVHEKHGNHEPINSGASFAHYPLPTTHYPLFSIPDILPASDRESTATTTRCHVAPSSADEPDTVPSRCLDQ